LVIAFIQKPLLVRKNLGNMQRLSRGAEDWCGRRLNTRRRGSGRVERCIESPVRSMPTLLDIWQRSVRVFYARVFWLRQLVASFLPNLSEKYWESLYHELPKIATFALCLERLTFLIRLHDGLLEQLIIHFRKERKRNLSFFLWLKIHSIEHPMLRIFVRRTRKIPKRYFRWALISNILEATAADLFRGFGNNALVGLKLSKWLMSSIEIQRKGHVVTFAPEDASEWIDLCHSWNMAFVSQAPEFPYVMCKLIIPSVAGYQGHPEEYIYRRAIALDLFCNAAALGYDKGERDWSDRKLTQEWGAHNLKQSKQNRSCGILAAR
jgi:hypothetical protein